MTTLGASAMNLEMNGTADGAIIAASTTNKLFTTLQVMLVDDGALLSGITVMSGVLIPTFLVTSADSGNLVMNTIMSGGEQETGIVWGCNDSRYQNVTGCRWWRARCSEKCHDHWCTAIFVSGVLKCTAAIKHWPRYLILFQNLITNRDLS